MKMEDVFKMAIGEEKKAQKLYGEAAKNARDPDLAAMFEQLVRDELGHERLLRERLQMAQKITEYTTEYDEAVEEKGKQELASSLELEKMILIRRCWGVISRCWSFSRPSTVLTVRR